MKPIRIIEEGSDVLNQFKTLQELSDYYNIQFDTIVADCEGFFEIFLYENLDYFDKINLILLEKDVPDFCNYFVVDEILKQKGFFINKESKMHVVYSRNKTPQIRRQEDINYLLSEFRKYVYLNEKNERINTLETEVQEQIDAVTYIPVHSKVLELGARYGTISCIINTILTDKTQMVVVEPDYSILDCLKQNMTRNHCNFHIYNGIICKENYNLIVEDYATRLKRTVVTIDNIDKLIDINIHNRYRIPSVIKTTLKPISNKISINTVDNNCGDYNVNCFFKNNNTIIIRIRRIDSVFGWDENELLLDVYNVGDNSDIKDTIKVPASKESFLEFEYSLSFPVSLVDLTYESKIPKVIMQTSEDNLLKSTYHINALYSMLEFNPEFEYRFYNASDRRAFIREHYPNQVLNAYDALIPGSFKADLFKYCYLYIFGGCYMDNKFMARKSIRNIIMENNQVVCSDTASKNAYYTAVMYHEPGDKRFYECIETIINNISVKLNSFTLLVSGPMVQYKHFKNTKPVLHQRLINVDSTLRHRYKDNYVEYKGEIYFNTFFKDYYHHNYTSYDKLFHSGLIYYDNYINNGSVIIYTYPTTYKYNVIIVDKTIIVKRIDEDGGWDNDLILHIINNNTNTTSDVFIGKSPNNTQILTLV